MMTACMATGLGLSPTFLAAADLILASAITPQARPAAIDFELQNQLDFRDVSFKDCYGKPVCRAKGASVHAYRINETGTDWAEAKLYWDPVDGLGVLGGGQDDEIDADEKIIVRFDDPKNVLNVWYTDLFAKEQSRYGRVTKQRNSLSSPANVLTRDYEKARATIYTSAGHPTQTVTFGVVNLPTVEFNEVINSDVFETGGDLRKRLLIEDGTASVLSGVTNDAGLLETTKVRLDENAERTENALQDIGLTQDSMTIALNFADQMDIPLVEGNTINNERMTAFLANIEQLGDILEASKLERVIGDVSNGEVPQSMWPGRSVQAIEFTAEADTSNDYSIAGFVFAND